MNSAITKTRSFQLTAFALVTSVLMTGLMLAPNSASAFWWPWGNHHAHAQNGGGDDETVTVTIHKYIDGEMATSESADSNSFMMNASWNDPDGLGEGSGGFELSSESTPAYTAVTDEMNVGASYDVSEVLDGDIVSTTCEDDHPYMLAGYSFGTSAEAAAGASKSTTAPSFTDLDENHHVIVWNETCDDNGNGGGGNATSTGSISGEVTGGASDEEPGELMVTSIDAQKTTAVANGEFEDGWQYVFNITVPSDETNLAMKFADWMHSGGEHTLPVGGNMRISSDQADNSGATVVLSDTDVYSDPALNITSDLDEEEDGLQIQVLVEVAVPEGTYNGTYSTEYGVRTLN